MLPLSTRRRRETGRRSGRSGEASRSLQDEAFLAKALEVYADKKKR
jgi:hypothetical protein